MPLMVNQLLLGRSTITTYPTTEEPAAESYMAINTYQGELMKQWWSHWKVQGLLKMFPYQQYIDAKRHNNLVKGDMCLLQYNGKVKATYRLCIILEIILSEEGLVCTVRVGFIPRRH